jgi:tetratricopeptide (TPR) repeat protein
LILSLLATGCSKTVDTTLRDELELKKDPNLEAFIQARDQGNPEKAFACAKALTERFPKNGSAWCKLGYAAEGLGKADQAIEYYQKAIEANPTHAKSWFNLGVQWGNKGRYEKEVEHYRQVLKLSPNHGKAWRNLGIAYSHLHREAESERAMKRALEIDSRFVRVFESNRGDSDGTKKPSLLPTRSRQQLSLNDLNAMAQLSNRTWSVSGPLTNYFTVSMEGLLNRDASSAGSATGSRSTTPAVQCYRSSRNIPVDLQGQVTNRLFSIDFKLQTPPTTLSLERLSPTQPPWERTGRILSQTETAAFRAAQALNEQGIQQEEHLQFADAIESYQKALKQLADDPPIWNNLGIAFARADRNIESVRAFEKGLQKAAGSKILLRNLALAQVNVATDLIHKGKIADAKALLQQTLRQQPDCVEARCQLIPLLVRENRWDDARPEYEVLTEELPDSVAAWYGLGYAWYRSGKGRSVLKALSRAIGIDPGNPEIWHLYGLQQIRLGDYHNAVESLAQAARLKPDSPETWYHLGIIQSQDQSWSDAAVSLQNALRLKPDWELAQKALAPALAASGQLAEAQTLYEKLLRRNSSQSQLWQELALVRKDLGDLKGAIAAWQRAASCTPKDGPVWAALGCAFAEEDRQTDACAAYQNAIAAGHSRAEVWNNLGVAYARSGELQEALKAFAEAINLQKNNSLLLFNTGIIYYRLKQNEDLSRTLQTLLQTDEQTAEELSRFVKTDQAAAVKNSSPKKQ